MRAGFLLSGNGNGPGAMRHSGFPAGSQASERPSGYALKILSKPLISLVEATAGFEPAYTDLQSAASPLRHVAPTASV
jgi:hypothetical protein